MIIDKSEDNKDDLGERCYHRFINGDEEAFKTLVTYYGANLIYFINGFVKNLTVAEDLMEETFCDLVYYKSRYKGKSSFKTYLFSIAKNKAVCYLKKENQAVTISLDDAGDIVSADLDLEKLIVKNEEYKQLYSALAKINNEYRNALYLFYFEDMSYDEIAKIMGKNNKQVKNLMYRAKQALKIIMEKDGLFYEE